MSEESGNVPPKPNGKSIAHFASVPRVVHGLLQNFILGPELTSRQVHQRGVLRLFAGSNCSPQPAQFSFQPSL